MPLQNINYGSVARSQILNENFEYLDDRITSTGSAITTVQSNLASVSSTINSRIDNLDYVTPEDLESFKDEVQDSVDELEARVDSISFIPDYSKATSVSLTNGGAVGFNGWLQASLSAGSPESNPWCAINGMKFTENRSGNASAAGYLCSGIVMVSSDDIVTWGCYPQTFYKIPFKGDS